MEVPRRKYGCCAPGNIGTGRSGSQIPAMTAIQIQEYSASFCHIASDMLHDFSAIDLDFSLPTTCGQQQNMLNQLQIAMEECRVPVRTTLVDHPVEGGLVRVRFYVVSIFRLQHLEADFIEPSATRSVSCATCNASKDRQLSMAPEWYLWVVTE